METNIYPHKAIEGLHFSFLHQCSKIKKLFDSAQCDTMRIAESVFSILKFEYLGEIETKTENILTHWLVTQTSSNDEKN